VLEYGALAARQIEAVTGDTNGSLSRLSMNLPANRRAVLTPCLKLAGQHCHDEVVAPLTRSFQSS
jgi:hypothetical protein